MKTAFSGGFVGFVLFSGSAGVEKARMMRTERIYAYSTSALLSSF
ncbi:hypothetical protein AB1Q30_001994 [Neisseria gonorrhoeae]